MNLTSLKREGISVTQNPVAQPGCKNPTRGQSVSGHAFQTVALAALPADSSAPCRRAQGDALGEKRLNHTVKVISKKTPAEMRMLGPGWRKVSVWKNPRIYSNPQWRPYRGIWHITRKAGEAPLLPLMVEPASMSAPQKQQLQDVFLQTDCLHNSSCGINCHLASHWKARRGGML